MNIIIAIIGVLLATKKTNNNTNTTKTGITTKLKNAYNKTKAKAHIKTLLFIHYYKYFYPHKLLLTYLIYK